MNITDRVRDYLPSRETLRAYEVPDPQSLFLRDKLRAVVPGAEYVWLYSHLEGKPLIVPAWHPLNRTTVLPNHAGDYASGVFEGMSVEPVTKDGELVGANIILLEPRVKRMEWSVSNRLFTMPVSLEAMKQGVQDLIAVLGSSVLAGSEGFKRAYIRPAARPGVGGLGVGVKPTHLIDQAILAMYWPYYFSDPERVYRGTGLRVAAMGSQRLTPLNGKHASNYGKAGQEGNVARDLGVDEALYFGPYLWDAKTGKKQDFNIGMHPDQFELLFSKGALADGPGEGLIALTHDGKLIHPPKDTNELPSTTMAYILTHLATRLGITVEEAPFTLRDVREGRITALAFVGNAARIAPLGEIQLHHPVTFDLVDTIRSLNPNLFHPLVQAYEEEVSGQITPSHPTLVTAVDLEGGKRARAVLDEAYAAYFLH